MHTIYCGCLKSNVCFPINYALLPQMQKDLVIYEMNVRAFTSGESSGLDNSIRGSYLGVIEKVIFV